MASSLRVFAHHRNVVILAVGNLIGMLGYSMMIPVMPIYLRSIGATWLALGLFTAVFGLMRAILQPVMGRISDRIGRKKMIVPALFAYSAIGYLYSTARTEYEFIGFRVAQGVSSSTLWPASDALIADTVPAQERGRALGAVAMTYQVGNIAGLGLGALVSYLWGVIEIFYFTALFALVGAIISLLFLRESRRVVIRQKANLDPSQSDQSKNGATGTVGSNEEAGSRKQSSYPPGGKRVIFSLGASSVFIMTAFSIMEVILSVLIVTVLGGTAFDLMIIWVGTSAITAVSGIYGGSLADKYSRRKIIVTVVSAAMAYWLLLTLTTSLLYLAVLEFVFAVVSGLVGPAISALLADVTPPDKRGATFGLLGMCNDTGLVLGPIISGLILDYLQLAMGYSIFGSMQLLFLVNALITAIAVLIAFVGIRVPKTRY